MIAPEVDHDFIKLAPTVNCATQSGKLQLEYHLPRSLHLRRVHGLGLGNGGLWIKLKKLAAAQTHGFELSHFVSNDRIGDLLRAELLVQIYGDPRVLKS